MKKMLLSLFAGIMMFTAVSGVNNVQVHAKSVREEVAMTTKAPSMNAHGVVATKGARPEVLTEEQGDSLLSIAGKGFLFILGVILRMGNVIVEAIGAILEWLKG